ncbi:hypothetical protein F5X98DRAFT_374100 [Xylaria grammica]|nr:hypothetical protein F5X98DRAFT_374100 [Xylaria grammica]
MHFQTWYPAWDLKTRMESNCSAELHDYMNESSSWCTERDYQCIAGVAVDCLLAALPETWKADMGAASVLLGLLPTTLSIVGSGPFETGLLAQTRPFLALMLALGSPVMYRIRIFDYPNLVDMFQHKKVPSLFHSSQEELTRRWSSLSNLAPVPSSVSSCKPNTFPLGWIFLGIPVHLIGAYAFFLCVSLQPIPGHVPSNTVMRWAKHEFRLSSRQPPLLLRFHDESIKFIVTAWICSNSILVHLFYGTVVFSSVLLIGSADTVIVIPRYWHSAVLCRLVLMFEISGIKSTTQIEQQDQGEVAAQGLLSSSQK